MKRKIFIAAVCAVLLCSCQNSTESTYAENETSSATSENSVAESLSDQSDSSEVQDTSSAAQQASLPEPKFEVLSPDTVNITAQLEDGDIVNIYVCEITPDSDGIVTQNLVYSGSAGDLNATDDGYTVEFDADNVISQSEYTVDSSDMNTDYYAAGIKLGLMRDGEGIISECIPTEVRIATGTVDQYDAALRGDTACGAASGTLLLQSVVPVWGDELTQRMSDIRDYSAVSFEYSVGANMNYYMSGQQIVNSVNKYLEDSGIEGIELTNFRTESPTEQTLIELISTGRPAVVEVCYARGNILAEYAGYSHWIAINGFRLTDDGYEFRWENTIGCEQNWVTSELLENANSRVFYSEGFQSDRFIVALKDAVADNLI